jgi:hypothetical protein
LWPVFADLRAPRGTRRDFELEVFWDGDVSLFRVLGRVRDGYGAAAAVGWALYLARLGEGSVGESLMSSRALRFGAARLGLLRVGGDGVELKISISGCLRFCGMVSTLKTRIDLGESERYCERGDACKQ